MLLFPSLTYSRIRSVIQAMIRFLDREPLEVSLTYSRIRSVIQAALSIHRTYIHHDLLPDRVGHSSTQEKEKGAVPFPDLLPGQVGHSS